MKLLTLSNPKLEKGIKKGYLVAGLHLAPHRLSGYNVCPQASKGCIKACLNTAGRGRFSQAARVRKTKMFFEDRANFMLQLEKNIQTTIRKAARKQLTLAIRLNVVSDIVWENIDFFGAEDRKSVV